MPRWSTRDFVNVNKSKPCITPGCEKPRSWKAKRCQNCCNIFAKWGSMEGRTLQPFEIQQSMTDIAALIDMNSTHPAVVHSELFFNRHMEAVAAGETPQLWAVWSFLQQSKAKARDILLKTAGLYLVWDRDPEQRLMLSRRMLESHLGLWIRKCGSNPVKKGIHFSNTIYYRTGEYILTHLEPMYIKLSRAAEQMSIRKQEVREELDQPFNI